MAWDWGDPMYMLFVLLCFNNGAKPNDFFIQEIPQRDMDLLAIPFILLNVNRILISFPITSRCLGIHYGENLT
jgi:hypothetical protein